MRRVLVVEDDRASGELLTVLLKGQGLHVDMAPSGEHALAALASGCPMRCCWTSACRAWTAGSSYAPPG